MKLRIESSSANTNPASTGGSNVTVMAVLLLSALICIGNSRTLVQPFISFDISVNPNFNNTPTLLQPKEKLQQGSPHFHSPYSEDSNFYPFSIRDSRRLVPTQIPPTMHVFDYVDISGPEQKNSKNSELFLDGYPQGKAPCQEYNLECYKQKIAQVFELVLQKNPDTEYFFYMESDNELCVPMEEVRRVAYEHRRYFITTGIGFSGWIMQRPFMVDFLDLLHNHPAADGPDPMASRMLIEKYAWAVTRQYLVSHNIQGGTGAGALTVRMPNEPPDGNKKVLSKHLPRCLEPRRGVWKVNSKEIHRDRFGWDYFEYGECDGEIFPCREGQLEELTKKYTKL